MQILSFQYVLGLVAAFLSLTLLLRVTVRFCRKRQTGGSSRLEMALGLSISAFSVGYLLLVLEVCFALFHVQSDFYGFTLSARKWHHRYWHPVNGMQLRDADHTPEDFEGKKPLFAVGDSIVAGYGINKHEDRFSNMLGRLLGEDWRVVTLAKSGWNSRQEFRALKQFTKENVVPETAILTYYVNDNTRAIRRAGYTEPRTVVKPTGLKREIIESSHLLNFVYWRVYRIIHAQRGEKYWNYIRKVSEDPRVWDLHREELQAFVDFAKEHDTRLIVLAFPHLLGIEWSGVFLDPVIEFFTSKGIETIDLREYVTGREPKEMVVNSLDSHPNEELHEEIAEILFEYLNKGEPVRASPTPTE